MDNPEQKFAIGTRVRLRDGIDPSFYNGFSRVGNEGWIRKRKLDKYKYPQVFIEWDRDAWGYNGTEDGWTWESHFEVVEENDMAEEHKNNQDSLEDTVRGITENFVQAIFGAMNPTESKPEPPDIDPEPEEDPNKWENLAAETTESIANAPAYLVIALERVKTKGDAPPMIIPRVFHAAQKPEYALVVQSQLAHLVASLQDATIAGVLELQQAANEDA